MTSHERQEVINTASEFLEGNPQGLRTNELTRRIRERHGDVPGFYEQLIQYAKQPGSLFFQPARGWWRHRQFTHSQDVDSSVGSVPTQAERILENKFYQPFADWLVEDLQECTKATVVGGNVLREKFGTPDVVGVYKPAFDDIVQFSVEVVSAEIKTATEGLITAFGQACSYRLFSHKSYIVVPNTAGGEDLDRLESLCLLLGIGLILFDSDSPQHPNFKIRTRATKHDPDMFYVNETLRRIGKDLLG